MLFADDDQVYALVTKAFGDARFQLESFDGLQRLGIVRGNMKNSKKRKILVRCGDIVLVSLRRFEADKADIIHRYTVLETEMMKRKGIIPSNMESKKFSKRAAIKTSCSLEDLVAEARETTQLDEAQLLELTSMLEFV
jgi:translation initiation factor 1A